MNLIPQSIIDNIRKLDAYPKTLDDFRVKTYGGACVTILSIVVALVLFISEVNYYLTPEIHEELLVDVSRGSKLSIYFDISFPKLPCNLISIDAIDVSGDQQVDIKHNIFRVKLGEDGKPIAEPKRDVTIGSKKDQFLQQAVPTTSPKPILDPHRCESCYGAESEDRKCCNTCDEVKEAYRDKGWVLKDVKTVNQCVREGAINDYLADNKEGCQVYGHAEVARVGGNFHIAPGKSMTQDHRHIHEMSRKDTAFLNVSHTINHLSFGPVIPGKSNILDGSTEISDEASMMYQYYVKIVATIFIKADGTTVDTNQFAVTRHQRRSSEGDSGPPGVYFIYEFAPMMVKYTERTKSFLHFLTSVFAIIGGVFTVAGIIDSMVYHSVNVIKMKIELGKTS